jgi:hypothetical protein
MAGNRPATINMPVAPASREPTCLDPHRRSI